MDRGDEPHRPLLKKPKGRDLELEAGSRAHFEDAAYYSQTYADRVEDVAFYVQLARKVPRVLEYGVGNGRIAIPLARHGVRVTGVDLSKAMLADLRVRLRAESPEVRARVVAKAGDMRRVKLRERFPLVLCTFNTALHLYEREDVEAWLARVREHLAPGGELVFDISMPILEDLTRDPRRAYRTPPFRHPTAGRVSYAEHFDYDRLRQILFVSMIFEPAKRKADADNESFMTPLAHRQFFPREMEALLHYNGFAIDAVHGDFSGGPLAPTSDVMIFRARPRRGFR